MTKFKGINVKKKIQFAVFKNHYHLKGAENLVSSCIIWKRKFI